MVPPLHSHHHLYHSPDLRFFPRWRLCLPQPRQRRLRPRLPPIRPDSPGDRCLRQLPSHSGAPIPLPVRRRIRDPPIPRRSRLGIASQCRHNKVFPRW
ncbi:hypothetical protein LINPERPRIM_LOCUS30243 [Linum perenne]